jgi:hypothetical protein
MFSSKTIERGLNKVLLKDEEILGVHGILLIDSNHLLLPTLINAVITLCLSVRSITLLQFS